MPCPAHTTARQHGVALITALLVVALATVLAVSLVEHLYFDIRRTENITRLDQAQLYNSNATEFGMGMLRLDRKSNNEYDTLAEYSDANEQVFPVTGGQVFAKILDQQGCFNLNNLSKTNSELKRYREIYGRLLANIGIDITIQPTLIDSLVDWLDPDDLTEPQGAEFDYYLGLEKPYRTANQLMVSPSELRLVKGYTAQIIDKISPYVCVLPDVKTGINVNTARAEVLDAFPGLKDRGKQIVSDRDGDPKKTDDDAPFATLNDFQDYVKTTLGVKKFDSKGLQVYSEYFMMQSNTQLGTGDVRLYSIIFRSQNDGSTRLVRQTRGAL